MVVVNNNVSTNVRLPIIEPSVLISVSDPSHFDLDPDPGIYIWEKMDPDPRIHLSVIVDPDPRIHIWKNWIRIRFRSGSGSGSEYLFLIFFIKKFMSDKLKCLFLLLPKFRKGISQITKTFSFTFYSK